MKDEEQESVMRAGAHVAFGVCSGSVAASFYANGADVQWGWDGRTLTAGVLVVFGSVCPDLDHPRAPLSRLLPFVARPISRRWPHRTLLHSLTGLGLWALIIYGLVRLMDVFITQLTLAAPLGHYGMLTGLFGFAYASHLVLDTCTRAGVRWLYPFVHNPFGYPSVEHYRIISGDKRAEWGVLTLSAGVLLWSLPVTMAGADTTLNNLLGSFQSLREIYVNAVNREVVLSFTGYTAQDKAPVSGKGVIVDVTAETFQCYWRGRVWRVGEAEAEVYLLSGRCRMLDAPPRVAWMTVRGATLAEMMTDFVSDSDGTVLLSGELVSNRDVMVRQPVRAKSVSLSSRVLTLTYATHDELSGLQIRPKEGAIAPPEVALQLTTSRAIMDSLMKVRSGLPASAMYERDRLYQHIEAHRTRIATLEKKQIEQREPTDVVRWSGRVTVREVPAIEE